MAWVVDTCVLLDIFSGDPQFAESSAECLARHLSDGLVVSPITFVELAPAFGGNLSLQEQFLAEVGVQWPSLWTVRDTLSAHELWWRHLEKKRQKESLKRLVADVLIQAFARRFQGLITRNPRDFAGVQVVSV